MITPFLFLTLYLKYLTNRDGHGSYGVVLCYEVG